MGKFQKWLARLDNNNAQGEFYITDVIGLAPSRWLSDCSCSGQPILWKLKVNNRLQLAKMERYYQRKQAENFYLQV